MLRHDPLGRLVQLSSAAVVAEAFPKTQHFLLWSGGERFDVRVFVHETIEVRLHGDDLCLLQHDLADPNRIRFSRFTPRQLACVLSIPAQDSAAERSFPLRVVKYYFVVTIWRSWLGRRHRVGFLHSDAQEFGPNRVTHQQAFSRESNLVVDLLQESRVQKSAQGISHQPAKLKTR